MDLSIILQVVTAGLLLAAGKGLVEMYKQINTLIAKIEAHDELDDSRFVALGERVDQIRLLVTPSPIKKRG